MPQASDALWEEVRAFLPAIDDMPSDAACIDFLRTAGYCLQDDWTWFKPNVNTFGQMTRHEFDCMIFLMHEWDFGGLKES
jgi:hypothetical protein